MDAAPPPPETTAQQAADLTCLGAGLVLANLGLDRDPPMVRIYLKRLQKTDPSRDWKALAPKFPDDMLYGEFMGIMNTCHDDQRSDTKRRKRPVD